MYNVNLAGKQSLTEDAPKIPFEKLVNSPNIAELLRECYLTQLGADVVEGYNTDCGTRTEWEQRTADATKLALQVAEDKSFPWVNCSNVKFPLVTIAALQFLARVSILTKGRNIVKTDVIGPDPTGEEAARGRRIANHMSYQLVEEDTGWVDDDERAKFTASIVGCSFKKTYFDPIEGINLSCHVPASKFVVDYYTRDLDKAQRATHVLDVSDNYLQEHYRRGLFLECSSANETPDMTLLQQTSDETQGIRPPAEDSLPMTQLLEQHLWLDLDGDGYREPYIVFVQVASSKVLRIVSRFLDQGDVFRKNDVLIRRLQADALAAADLPEMFQQYQDKIEKLQKDPNNDILRIVPQAYFTKIPFIPSPDGGFYDLGLGALLGPLNDSVNSIVNQLIDNGTMQNTAGGFLGRGVKIKGGKTSFDPFEWKPVDSNGDDLRKNIVPLVVAQPSAVLFQLLGMLINYGERISGATDIMSGVSPGQNTPAETSRNTIEQGMKLFSGIYGRMHRAFRSELRKLYVLNQLYLEDNANFYDLVSGKGAIISRKDYLRNDVKVRPAADPATVSEVQRQQRASIVMQTAHSNPGYDMYQVNLDFLEAYEVPNISLILPDPTGERAIKPGPDPTLVLEQQKLELERLRLELDEKAMLIEFQQQAQLNEAKITQLQAKATKELAEADGIQVNQQIAAINAQIGAANSHQQSILSAISMMHKSMELRQKAKPNADHTTRQTGMDRPSSDQGTPPKPGEPSGGSEGELG